MLASTLLLLAGVCLTALPRCGAEGDVAGPSDSAGTGGTGGSGGSSGAAGTMNTDGGVGGPPYVDRTFVVHASPELWPFRLCFIADGEVLSTRPLPADPDRPVPLTSFPGVAIGGFSELPELDALLGSHTQVTPYLLRADAPELRDSFEGSPLPTNCEDFLCNSGAQCMLGTPDAIKLPTVRVDTMLQEGVDLLTVTGCREAGEAEVDVSADLCGPGFTPSGNLSLQVLRIFQPEIPFDEAPAGLWLAALSPSLEARRLAAGGETLVKIGKTTDSATWSSIASNAVYLQVSETEQAAPALPSTLAGLSETAVSVLIHGADTDEVLLTQALAHIQTLSDPLQPPDAFFSSSQAFLLAVMGDASGGSEPLLLDDGNLNPLYDGRGLHVVALPVGLPPQAR